MTMSKDTAVNDQKGKASGEDGVSRRTWLGGAAVAFGVGASFLMTTRAEAKAAQKSVMYQDTPKGKSHCSICMQFQAPNACKLVDGTINPDGWCELYTPKAA